MADTKTDPPAGHDPRPHRRDDAEDGGDTSHGPDDAAGAGDDSQTGNQQDDEDFETRALNPEERESLMLELEPIDRLESSLAIILKPYRETIAAMDAVRASIFERYGVPKGPAGKCEHCETVLFQGDLVHFCQDGPMLCYDHAPSWGELKSQIEKERASIKRETGEVPPEIEDELAAIEEFIENGGSTQDKVVEIIT